jgi:anti-sigma-K factor RskA
MSEHDEHLAFSDDAAAYVLGALEPHEATRFRVHVESCASCAAELERLGWTAAVLPLAAAQLQVPKRLRRRVLRAAADDARRAPQPVRGVRSGWWLARPWPTGVAALVVGTVLGALVLAPGRGPTSVIRASVASAAAWHARSRPVALLERYGDRGQLQVTNLPSAGAGKIYELWIERDDIAQPTNVLFEPTSSGQAAVDVPGELNGASAVLVTAEPLGGAKVPSMAPLIDARLAA